MASIWQALNNTPWWVYVLLAYLVTIGIKAAKTQVVSLKKLFIMPILFTFLSVHALLTSVKTNAFAISCWAIAMALGILVGWLQTARYDIKIDKTKYLIQIPGNWSTLIIISIIFVSKYYFGYKLAVDPQMVNHTWFEVSLLGVTGICAGLFVGRLSFLLSHMQKQPSVNLTEE
jgi:hypothetical protein